MKKRVSNVLYLLLGFIPMGLVSHGILWILRLPVFHKWLVCLEIISLVLLILRVTLYRDIDNYVSLYWSGIGLLAPLPALQVVIDAIVNTCFRGRKDLKTD
jgi:hypothetical protein